MESKRNKAQSRISFKLLTAQIDALEKRLRLLESQSCEENASDVQKYLEGREKWTHEDKLINHRLGWLLVSQSILFAAYGSVLRDSEPGAVEARILLSFFLPLLGLATSWFIYMGISAAGDALNILDEKYEGVSVSRETTASALFCAEALPVSFIFAWCLSFLWAIVTSVCRGIV